LPLRGPSNSLLKFSLTWLNSWGEGEWGIINTGNIQIDLKHIGSAGNTAIPLGAPFSGERFEAFKELAAAGKAHGSLMVGQVCHPGRQIEEKYVKEGISATAVQLGESRFRLLNPPVHYHGP